MTKCDYSGCFGDVRLDRRGNELQSLLFRNATRCIQTLSANRAQQKAFYRFLRNDQANEAKLISAITGRCAKQVAGRVVLSIQDTTEINLSAHAGRVNKDTGLGSIDHSAGIGFKLHPSFVVDATSCFPIGFSDIRAWARDDAAGNKYERRIRQQPVTEKESYKWTDSSLKSRDVLSSAKAVIIVQDREGDIFSQFTDVPDKHTFLLIRSRVNRTTGEGDKLWPLLAGREAVCSYELHLPADSHSREPARTASMEIRYVKTVLKNPESDKVNKGKTVPVYAVEAREKDRADASGGIYWRLVTTWPVNNAADAATVIEWYSWRWLIEELFRVLKKECFDIEASELESGWAIRKLTVMLLDTIVKLMQMHMAYNSPEGESPDAGLVFTDEEQDCLPMAGRKLEGKTEQLKNPYQRGSLKWAVWIISRLGGWKGYGSQRPPGMTTMFKGLEKFNSLFEGWRLAKDVGTR